MHTQELTLIVQEQVHYHYSVPRLLFAETKIEPRGERSLEEITHQMTLSPTTYAFHLEKVARTTTSIDGHTVHLVSQPWHTALVYVGGTIYTLDELQAQHPEESRLIENIAQAGPHARAIRTRTGQWHEFRGEENFIEQPE